MIYKEKNSKEFDETTEQQQIDADISVVKDLMENLTNKSEPAFKENKSESRKLKREGTDSNLETMYIKVTEPWSVALENGEREVSKSQQIALENIKVGEQEQNKLDVAEDCSQNTTEAIGSVSVVPEEKLEEELKGKGRPVALSNEEVTEHTAGLWKYLPVPDGQVEPAPEYIYGMEEFSYSKVIGARVRGKKHKHEGSNCDDWYEVGNFENITFVAVSDGAGSKKFSRIGAREACKAVIKSLVEGFKQALEEDSSLKENMILDLDDSKGLKACTTLAGLVQNAVIQGYNQVEVAYNHRKNQDEYKALANGEIVFKDFSSTLLVVAIIPVNPNTKEQLIISCQIGDGMIVTINSQGDFNSSIKLMGVSDGGEFAGETDFITSQQMKQLNELQTRTKISKGLADYVFVMTDGVSDDYFPNETQMRRLYFDLIANGIIKRPDGAKLSAEDVKLLKMIPDPLLYPWVNDKSVKVATQYTKRICEFTDLSFEELWKNSRILELASFEVQDAQGTLEPSQQLKVWLDNYVERGSFDDRTLVIVQM